MDFRPEIQARSNSAHLPTDAYADCCKIEKPILQFDYITQKLKNQVVKKNKLSN